MKILSSLIVFLSTFSIYAATEPTMKCKFGQNRELKVYGPLGYFYESDVRQNSEINFPNTVEIIIDNTVVNTLPNSTSMVNDKNEYTVTSYVLGVRDLSLKKVLNLYFASEKGSVAHADINVGNFRYRGKAFCRLIH